MSIEILGSGQPDGTGIAKATTEKVSIYGGTPVVQAATIADVGVLASVYCVNTAATDAGAVAIVDMATKLNTLLSDLEDLGILASA